jgi:hypothetical protein
MHFGEIDLACSVIKKGFILIKYPPNSKVYCFKPLILFSGQCFLWKHYHWGKPFKWFIKFMVENNVVSSKYKSTTTIPIFFPEEDLDSDNDVIPNSLEDQECLSIGLNYEFYDGIPTGPRH